MNIPLRILLDYKRIKERTNGNKVVATCTILEIIGRAPIYIPKELRYPILKEMESYGLIRRINKLKYEISGGPVDSKLNKYSGALW